MMKVVNCCTMSWKNQHISQAGVQAAVALKKEKKAVAYSQDILVYTQERQSVTDRKAETEAEAEMAGEIATEMGKRQEVDI